MISLIIHRASLPLVSYIFESGYVVFTILYTHLKTGRSFCAGISINIDVDTLSSIGSASCREGVQKNTEFVCNFFAE